MEPRQLLNREDIERVFHAWEDFAFIRDCPLTPRRAGRGAGGSGCRCLLPLKSRFSMRPRNCESPIVLAGPLWFLFIYVK